MVLNSLSGEFIEKSFTALAPKGRFIEIGKAGVWTPEQARKIRPEALYEVVDLIDVGRRQPGRIREVLEQIVGAFNERRLQPLPLETFPAERTAEAFRTMAQARHVGKIVVTYSSEKDDSRINLSRRRDKALFSREGACLITGGYGGLGLLLAEWLAKQGVRHLVLLGRRQLDDRGKTQVAAIENAGAKVLCATGDVAREEDVRNVLNQVAHSMPPLCGIFHCAGVLDDGALLQMNPARFSKVLEAKVHGARILDRLTRPLPIERFVLFSTWSSLFGSLGQANHSAANAYLDGLAHARRASGLPGQSINWGPWAEIGAAAAYAEHLASRGVGSFSPAEGLAALEILLRSDRVQVAVAPFNGEKWLSAIPSAARTRLFERLQSTPSTWKAGVTAGIAKKPRNDIRSALASAQGLPQRTRVMEEWLREQVSAVLRIGAARIDPAKPLKSLGFDSLLSVEFRNRLELDLGLTLPATLIWNYPTVARLAGHLLERLATFGSTEETETPRPKGTETDIPGTTMDAESIARLSDEEAAEELDRRLRLLEGNP